MIVLIENRTFPDMDLKGGFRRNWTVIIMMNYNNKIVHTYLKTPAVFKWG